MSAAKDYPRFCVLGAGHGGMAMAGHLAHARRGGQYLQPERTADRPIRLTGGIELSGAIEGFGRVAVATTEIEEAMTGVDVLMVVVPANGHRFMAEKVAPHLVDGQIIVLNPGRTGGAFEFRHTLAQQGVTADVIVAEAQTLIYAARAINPAQVKVYGVKNTIPVAALPGQRTVEVLKVLRLVYPQFVPGRQRAQDQPGQYRGDLPSRPDGAERGPHRVHPGRVRVLHGRDHALGGPDPRGGRRRTGGGGGGPGHRGP